MPKYKFGIIQFHEVENMVSVEPGKAPDYKQICKNPPPPPKLTKNNSNKAQTMLINNDFLH